MALTPTPNEIEELILRSLQGKASAQEERLLASWLEGAPQYRMRYEELREVWRLAGLASPAVRSLRRPSARELIGHKASVEPSKEKQVAATGGVRLARWGAPLAAAAAIAALAIGLGIGNPGSEGSNTHFGAAELATGPRETVTVRLDDGTIVRLAPNSSLRMDGTGGKRNVWLDGQAFLAVSYMPEAPFTVRTSAGTATVLGTRFDVWARDSELRLVVVDGRVRVAAGPDARYTEEVGASEMGQVTEGQRVYVSQVSDVFSVLEWMEGTLIFQSTPLEQVARELELRYQVQVDLMDPTVGDRTITAWFNDDSLDATIDVVCRAANVKCATSESRVRIGL